jgi:hypothetical protein
MGDVIRPPAWQNPARVPEIEAKRQHSARQWRFSASNPWQHPGRRSRLDSLLDPRGPDHAA